MSSIDDLYGDACDFDNVKWTGKGHLILREHYDPTKKLSKMRLEKKSKILQ